MDALFCPWRLAAEIVEALLEAKANPEGWDLSESLTRVSAGTSALFRAVQDREGEALVRPLLAYKANPSSANRAGTAALVVAVRRGRTGLVQTLLEAGAKANLTDARGTSALFHAVAHPMGDGEHVRLMHGPLRGDRAEVIVGDWRGLVEVEMRRRVLMCRC